MKRASVIVLACATRIALADDAVPPHTPVPPAVPPVATDDAAPPQEPAVDLTPPLAPAADAPPTPAELAAELDELYSKQRELDRAQRRDDAIGKQVETLLPLRRFITVFVDVGAFVVGGDGSGIRPDVGHVYFPEYTDQIAGQWVFMGDPLSTAINSFGEPSDTSSSRSLARDTINSEGLPSLLVNTLGLAVTKSIGHGVSVAGLAHLLPRPAGTAVDVQLATIEYRPLADTNLVFGAGKVDSVLGIEYRTQDPRQRVGVTPSLICRYTCGRPLGLRAQLELDRFHASATLTNGDNFQELFEPDRELASNALPTASAHVQWKLPVARGLLLGVSGAIGPQDGQRDIGREQWHVGADAQLVDLDGWNVAAEYVQGRQPGKTLGMIECSAAACLTYKGAYVLVDRRLTSWFAPYARIDWRSAVHTNGTDFVYESHTGRATLGGHFEMTSRIIGKVEYTYNRELGRIPQFPNDVLTTSIVVATD